MPMQTIIRGVKAEFTNSPCSYFCLSYGNDLMRIRQLKFERKKKHTVGTFVCMGKNLFSSWKQNFLRKKMFSTKYQDF